MCRVACCAGVVIFSINNLKTLNILLFFHKKIFHFGKIITLFFPQNKNIADRDSIKSAKQNKIAVDLLLLRLMNKNNKKRK